MKSIVIKSNQGNHSGFNRQWEILNGGYAFNTIEEALSYCAHRHNDIKELSEEDEDYRASCQGFEDDLCYYYVVTQDEYVNGFFNGNHHGYVNQAIIDIFEPEI